MTATTGGVEKRGAAITTRPVSARLGCVCGCLNGVDCAAGRHVADIDGSCCGRLGFAELNIAVRRGWHCAAGCVARRLDLGGGS